MESVKFETACNCPIECESVSYSFTLVSTPFDSKRMCPAGAKSTEFLMKQFYLNKYPPHFIGRLNEFKDNITSNGDEICMKNIKYRAEITFRLAANTLSVTVMSRRLSLFDKVSAFGKIC